MIGRAETGRAHSAVLARWDPVSGTAHLHWRGPETGARHRTEFASRVLLSFAGDRLTAIDLFDCPDSLTRVRADHAAAHGVPIFDAGWLWLPLATGPVTKRLAGHGRIEVVVAGERLAEVRVTARLLWNHPGPQPPPVVALDGTAALSGVRLVAMDLDGTLLDSTGTVPSRVRAAVRAAARGGVRPAFVTGRPLADTVALLRAADLRGHVACSNGAVVLDETGRVLHRRAIDGERAAAVRRILRGTFPELTLGAVDESRLFLDPGFPADLAQDWRSQLCAGPVSGALDDGRVLKVLAAHPASTAEELAPAVSGALGGAYQVTYSTQRFLEISDARATKGAAVAAVAAATGVPLTAVAAVGDMPNDLPMMEPSALAVAVGNAHPRVLDAADLIVRGNDLDGVAELLDAVLAARRESGRAEAEEEDQRGTSCKTRS
ncbi:hydrolase [Streptomyces sp. NBRC 110611]|uniref:HAD family hydrolase n=1 Tax=Streptomyces sp. NBRC 110611 TaxID=1621259 RepID=UPI000857E692|nr:HAD family hydrolase [Streptomyces sp. NBRC 110611]GAU66495.1 hydrolase [Streptomyces sp. NBRC 110611]